MEITEDFKKTNQAFYLAKMSHTLHGFIDNFPEAGQYLIESIDGAVLEESDTFIEHPLFLQRIKDHGIMDSSSSHLRYEYALFLQEAFNLSAEDGKSIHLIHNPQQPDNSGQEQENCCEVVGTQTVGFQLQSRKPK